MTLTIEIAPDLERRLREVAARAGVDPSQYASAALRDYLSASCTENARLEATEIELLQQINCGLSDVEWRRYHELVEKRRAEQLDPQEYAELTATSDRLEKLNAWRLECLAKLAKKRHVPLPELMQELGINAPAVI